MSTNAKRNEHYRRFTLVLMWCALALVTGCSNDDPGYDGSRSESPRRKAIRIFVFPREVEPLGEATVAIETEACDDACYVCLRAGEPDRGRLLGPPGATVDEAAGLVIVPANDTLTLTSLVFRAPNREGSDVIAASLVQPTSTGSPCDGTLVDTTTGRVITRRAPVPTPGEEPDSGLPDPPPAPVDSGAEPTTASDAG